MDQSISLMLYFLVYTDATSTVYTERLQYFGPFLDIFLAFDSSIRGSPCFIKVVYYVMWVYL